MKARYQKYDDGDDGETLNYKMSNPITLKPTQRLGQGILAHSAAANVSAPMLAHKFQQIRWLSTPTKNRFVHLQLHKRVIKKLGKLMEHRGKFSARVKLLGGFHTPFYQDQKTIHGGSKSDVTDLLPVLESDLRAWNDVRLRYYTSFRDLAKRKATFGT